MSKVQANGISIEVEDSGPGGALPPVLLVMGLGMQLTAWPPAFVQGLVDAGHRVVRFDNRDIGLSTRLDHLRSPNLMWEGMKARVGLPCARRTRCRRWRTTRSACSTRSGSGRRTSSAPAWAA